MAAVTLNLSDNRYFGRIENTWIQQKSPSPPVMARGPRHACFRWLIMGFIGFSVSIYRLCYNQHSAVPSETCLIHSLTCHLPFLVDTLHFYCLSIEWFCHHT